MATKKTTKKTTKKAAPVKAAARDLSVRDCVSQSSVLKLHMTVITVLSCVVCALVVALLLALKDHC